MHASTSSPASPWSATAAALILAAEPGRLWASPLLVETPEPGGYISWLRVVIILLAMLPWLAFCQWVDKDISYVRKINRDLWNAVVLGGGTVGLGLWLLLPWQTAGLFAAGFGLWLVLTVGSCAAYVLVRNSIVDSAARVFTPRHIRAWLGTLGRKKQEQHALIERVKLINAAGKKVPVPDDPTQVEPYEAAQILLHDALWRRASEVQLVVGSRSHRLAYRIDGVVTARNDLLSREHAALAIQFIKQIAGLVVNEHRKPQTGRIRGSIGSDRGMTDIEVVTSGTTEYEQLALRIVGEETRLRLSDLGLDPPALQRLEEVVAQPGGGLVLVSGPRASGVTTTLYAFLRQHDAFMQNLLTIERARLMELENITQYIYDPTKHEGSYARQLQTVLRREPDVVMIGECLDRETAHLAVEAAADGKRIYMGIQAKDCFDALRKLLSLAGDTEGVAQVLRAVTAQRLIRKLCIACRLAYRPDAELLKKANLPADKIEHFYRQPRPEEYVDEKGKPRICPNCQNSGFFGRTGVFEVMIVDEAMRELIRNGQPMTRIRSQALKNGMVELQYVGFEKIIAGVTSMSEMLRVLRDEEENPARSVGKAVS